jgi:chromosome segregation ATPase
MFQYFIRDRMLTDRSSRQSLIVALRLPRPSRKDRIKQIQKKSRDKKRAEYQASKDLALKLEDDNRVLAETNKELAETNEKLKQENHEQQRDLFDEKLKLRQLETDLQRAYETRDALSMKLQSTEERCQEITASYLELQAQHGTCKEQFIKDQLRDTWRQEENERLQKEVDQLRERDAEHQSAIASWRRLVELQKARIQRLNAAPMNVSEEPYMSSTFWDPVL